MEGKLMVEEVLVVDLIQAGEVEVMDVGKGMRY